jgi:DNA polymerase III epsilon subunit-like protein
LIHHYQVAHNFFAKQAVVKTKKAETTTMCQRMIGENLNAEIKMIILDLETTGLIDKSKLLPKIIKIATKNILTEDVFHTLINLEMPIPASASQVNHITNDMVEGSPIFPSTGTCFLE